MNGADEMQVLTVEMAAQGGLEVNGDVVIEAKPQAALPEDWPEGAKLLADSSVILTLDWPVSFKMKEADGTIRSGDSYTTLPLRRLKGKHKQLLVNAAQKSAVEVEKALLGASTGLDAGKIELLYNEMDQSDIASAMAVINFFTGRGRKTGQPS